MKITFWDDRLDVNLEQYLKDNQKFIKKMPYSLAFSFELNKEENYRTNKILESIKEK